MTKIKIQFNLNSKPPVFHHVMLKAFPCTWPYWSTKTALAYCLFLLLWSTQRFWKAGTVPCCFRSRRQARFTPPGLSHVRRGGRQLQEGTGSTTASGCIPRRGRSPAPPFPFSSRRRRPTLPDGPYQLLLVCQRALALVPDGDKVPYKRRRTGRGCPGAVRKRRWCIHVTCNLTDNVDVITS